MHRIVAKDQIVPVRERRADNEFGIRHGLEFHCCARGFEKRESANRNWSRTLTAPDAMAAQRTVWPAGGW
ncbi:MAG: hypothetical protein WBD81_21580 [Collimonas pratensis]|uniref:hypothetical protein n=1 Tax=Collimonas pratensis TaxID=279113 RepID=UPI003C74E4E9